MPRLWQFPSSGSPPGGQPAQQAAAPEGWGVVAPVTGRSPRPAAQTGQYSQPSDLFGARTSTFPLGWVAEQPPAVRRPVRAEGAAWDVPTPPGVVPSGWAAGQAQQPARRRHGAERTHDVFAPPAAAAGTPAFVTPDFPDRAKKSRLDGWASPPLDLFGSRTAANPLGWVAEHPWASRKSRTQEGFSRNELLYTPPGASTDLAASRTVHPDLSPRRRQQHGHADSPLRTTPPAAWGWDAVAQAHGRAKGPTPAGMQDQPLAPGRQQAWGWDAFSREVGGRVKGLTPAGTQDQPLPPRGRQAWGWEPCFADATRRRRGAAGEPVFVTLYASGGVTPPALAQRKTFGGLGTRVGTRKSMRQDGGL